MLACVDCDAQRGRRTTPTPSMPCTFSMHAVGLTRGPLQDVPPRTPTCAVIATGAPGRLTIASCRPARLNRRSVLVEVVAATNDPPAATHLTTSPSDIATCGLVGLVGWVVKVAGWMIYSPLPPT